MGKRYLYEVTIDGGKNNPNFWQWYQNVSSLNAKAPDFAGIQNLCILSHSQSADTVHLLCTDGFKKKGGDSVTVTEITRQSLKSANSPHWLYQELVTSYFLPHDSYPNIV